MRILLEIGPIWAPKSPVAYGDCFARAVALQFTYDTDKLYATINALTHEQLVGAVRLMARHRYEDYEIAAETHLSVKIVRQLLAGLRQ